jgi:hypothetical protein
MSAAAFEYFATSSMAIVRPRMPAPLQAGETDVDEEREQVVGVLLALVDLAGTGRNAFLRQLSDGGLELGELVGELVIHDR